MTTLHRTLFACLILLSSCLNPTLAADESVVGSYAKVKQSLAIVVSSGGIGTAFCVSSSATSSYYLTNLHVVGSDSSVILVRQYPTISKMPGTVVAHGVRHFPPEPTDVDLAIIRVSTGNIPTLALRMHPTQEGERVAVAGYPAAQFDLGSLGYGLTPSIHLGTVSALQTAGRFIEYDAPTWFGNSGGPVFDPATGDVIAIADLIVTNGPGASLGISVVKVLVPFLNRQGIGYRQANTVVTSTPLREPSPSPEQMGPIPNVAGAGHFVVIDPAGNAQNEQQRSIISAATNDLAANIHAMFGVSTSTVIANPHTKEEIAQVARENDAIAAVYVSYTWNAHEGLWTKTDLSAKEVVSLVDRFGFQGYSSSKEKSGGSGQANFANAIVSAFADLSDQNMAQIHTYLVGTANDPSILTNYTRYALPMATGSKRAFYDLKNDGGRIVAYSVAPFGSAAEAGLQNGDEVTSVNGHSTSGLSSGQVEALIQDMATQGATFDLEVRTADGTTSHIKFDRQDIRYYVNKRNQN